ncbi:MAG: hypothetical protein EU532_07330 [Promethearchaeota archaeon]|nr:MAG: hypothetical protein EU532_07330 [Candidatus Lokiarchaeota archaeon]
MSHKEKIINVFRKGYEPTGFGPKEKLNSIFNNTFKPLVNKKDLNIFLELCESSEPLLRAWGFLGLSHIIKDKSIYEEEKKLRFQKIIANILTDKSRIEYYGGSSEIQTTLREHHVKRVCEFDPVLTFEPVYRHVQAHTGKTDDVIVDLLENVLSKVSDPRIEPLILNHANNIDKTNFGFKLSIINAFENLSKKDQIKDKKAISDLFRNYLRELNEDTPKIESLEESKKIELSNKKKSLHESLLKVAAVLNLDFEKETLEFLDSLNSPYEELYKIAEQYKDNERFKSILLDKLENSNNPQFIKDILMCIMILHEKTGNWKQLIIENVNKYQIIDNDLIEEMQKFNVFDETMLIKFLNEGEKWQLDFIREFLLNNPEILEMWVEFQNQFIKILTSFQSNDESINNDPNFYEKKELALKLLIDLERKDLVKYCIDNFKNLDDDHLRKLSLFIIIKLGTNEILLELKQYLETNKESAEFFKKFWRSLENRDMQFYY